MRGKRARQLRELSRDVVMVSGVKKDEDYRGKVRRLYRVMKRDWKEGRRDGFAGTIGLQARRPPRS